MYFTVIGVTQYRLYQDPTDFFSAASSVCDGEFGGTLANPLSQEVNQVLQRLVNRVPRSRPFTYIGMQDVNERDWYFETRKDMRVPLPGNANGRYQNWARGEPDDVNDCGAITLNGKWDAVDCDLRLQFICEKGMVILV